MDKANRLTVFHDDNSSFSDHSFEAYDFLRDSFDATLLSATSYLYVGLYKPFSRFYVELDTANTNANTFTAEYYNGSSWASLDGFLDDSEGFTRSGELRWFRAQTDWAETAVNSETKYWVRLRPSADHSATTIQGLNVLFSDDSSLKEEFFEISDFLPNGASSFVAVHQGVRKEIVQSLRNAGRNKRNSSSVKFEKLTEWDLLDIDEVRQAAKFLALEKIFRNVSDQVDDKYQAFKIEFRDKYNDAFSLLHLSLDDDDDGILDTSEAQQIVRVEVRRL